jgi:hypothetical protein
MVLSAPSRLNPSWRSPPVQCYEPVAMTSNITDIHLTEIQELYRQAFRDFGAHALWSMRPASVPSPADALAITAALRTHGRMEGRRLAERIEGLCRADQ